jgi:O-methyltransferase
LKIAFWWLYARIIEKDLTSRRIRLLRVRSGNLAHRYEGREWPAPPDADTMIGMLRLNNLEQCIVSVMEDGVPGDLIESKR